MRFFGVFLIVVMAAAGAHSAGATAPEPRLKPSPPHFSTLLSEGDFRRLREGLAAAEDGEWSRVLANESAITDPSARNILFWRRAVSSQRMSFSELDQALERLENWPRMNEVRESAEIEISRAGRTAQEIVDWFDENPPESGPGHVALADALFALGRTAQAETALRTAWREHVLPLELQDEVIARHRSRLSRDDHEARVDYLLWRGQRTAARRLFSHISSGHRALADARIRLAGRQRGVDTAIEAVPASLQSHPGLLYERARWRRRARMTDNAEPLIADIPRDVEPIAARSVIWTERRIHVRRAIGRGDYAAAYQMAAANGLSRGVSFADAEWLAGWLALTRLNRPEDAAVHFERLENGVSTPISTARARYWRGRAAEAMGLSEEANAYYASAAEFPTVYYGQLAAERLGGDALLAALPEAVEPTADERAAFFSRDTTRAIQMLAELDELRLFREMVYAYDDTLEAPADLVLLAEIARDYGQNGIAVRAGKAGLARGVVASEAAYPLVSLPPLPAGAPEEAFVLALMRQESEFYPRAVSGAGARGLMQLMPATASRTARSAGLSYQRNWLTDDPYYNMRVGTEHLADLMDEFNGSYVLIAVAYNAGPTRARRWAQEYGDPRDPRVDVVDWVENIPFSETRDYVQRILENTQVYRGRLNGGVIEIALNDDLRSGYR